MPSQSQSSRSRSHGQKIRRMQDQLERIQKANEEQDKLLKDIQEIDNDYQSWR